MKYKLGLLILVATLAGCHEHGEQQDYAGRFCGWPGLGSGDATNSYFAEVYYDEKNIANIRMSCPHNYKPGK